MFLTKKKYFACCYQGHSFRSIELWAKVNSRSEVAVLDVTGRGTQFGAPAV